MSRALFVAPRWLFWPGLSGPQFPRLAHAASSSPSSASATPPTQEDGPEGPPPPLPADPEVLAELFARLDRGMEDVRAGRGIAWEELDRRTRSKYGLPPA